MEAVINTRALCLYLLIVAAWRRAVLCALVAAAEQRLADDGESIDRNGNTVGFTYNNMNRASQISHPAPLNSNSASSTVISYTLRGDMSYYTSPEVNKEFVYDALRRKTLEGQYMPSWPTVPPGGMLYAEFEYDKKNRMTYTMDFSGMETVTVYDDVNQTKTVTDVTNSQTTNIGYDPAGNMTTKTSPNGLTDNYTYDTDNRLSYQEIRDSNNTLMGNKAYTYNDNSQIEWDSASGYFGNYYTDYTFNNCRLLATEVRTGTNGYNKSYTYDGMYNRTVKVENGVTTTYSYNGLGRITQSVSNGVTTTYTYDNNGNLISKSDGTNTETYEHDWKNNMVHYTDTNGNKDVYYGYDIANVKIVKAWEASEEEQMSSMSGARPGAFTPRIVAQVSGTRTLNNPLSPGSYNTCADITGRKFYYHKLQISNVCDACTDILDTSSWDNDSSWIWEQAFFNDFASGMSLTEYEETTARKTGVGPYTVHYDCWGSMAVQTTGNAGTWQMLECDAIGVVTASQAVVGSSLIGALCSRTDYFDWYGNEYGSGGVHFNASVNTTLLKDLPSTEQHNTGLWDECMDIAVSGVWGALGVGAGEYAGRALGTQAGVYAGRMFGTCIGCIGGPVGAAAGGILGGILGAVAGHCLFTWTRSADAEEIEKYKDYTWAYVINYKSAVYLVKGYYGVNEVAIDGGTISISRTLSDHGTGLGPSKEALVSVACNDSNVMSYIHNDINTFAANVSVGAGTSVYAEVTVTFDIVCTTRDPNGCITPPSYDLRNGATTKKLTKNSRCAFGWEITASSTTGPNDITEGSRTAGYDQNENRVHIY